MQAHFLEDYPVLVDNLLASMPEDEAMARAVGSNVENFHKFGALQRQILIQAGLKSTDSVVDMGCGSGRLASALIDDHEGFYVGFDIVEKLVAYAAETFVSERFRFFPCHGLEVPLDAELVDFATFFSVFTHLKQEETFLYMLDALRVLRPGGTLVCSYLDLEQNWGVFETTVSLRDSNILPHANVFMTPETLRILLEGAGFEVVSIFRPHEPFIEFEDAVEFHGGEGIPAGIHTLGQGTCIARKPDVTTTLEADAVLDLSEGQTPG